MAKLPLCLCLFRRTLTPLNSIECVSHRRTMTARDIDGWALANLRRGFCSVWIVSVEEVQRSWSPKSGYLSTTETGGMTC